MYKQLAEYLDHSREDVVRACEDLGLDYHTLNHEILARYIQQCTHCDIWTQRWLPDLDKNPICSVCRDIAGL